MKVIDIDDLVLTLNESNFYLYMGCSAQKHSN